MLLLSLILMQYYGVFLKKGNFFGWSAVGSLIGRKWSRDSYRDSFNARILLSFLGNARSDKPLSLQSTNIKYVQQKNQDQRPFGKR